MQQNANFVATQGCDSDEMRERFGKAKLRLTRTVDFGLQLQGEDESNL